MAIYEDLIQLHEDLVEFASKVQATSSNKMNNESHIGVNVYTVFYKIYAYAVTLH
jgi:hypothetical protein